MDDVEVSAGVAEHMRGERRETLRDAPADDSLGAESPSAFASSSHLVE